MGDVEHDISRIVSRSLDCLGYNQDIVKYRIQHYRDEAIMLQGQGNVPVNLIFAGSKGEGITSAFESDIDLMSTLPYIVCYDNIQIFSNCPNLTLFKMDRDDSYPGYTQLKLVQYGREVFTNIVNSLFESEVDELYISSEFYCTSKTNHLKAAFKKMNKTLHIKDHIGPSQPVYISGSDNGDHVDAFYCYCPDILQSWMTRPRYYNWPTPQLLYDISQMEAHVVPVGFKGSENSYKEWRICFTKAELHLIQNFNDTQTKLYVLLKLVAKVIIKPICDDVTSYVMKNVVLWMAEYNPEYLFREELLIDRLVQALIFLKSCIEANFLPNYMIPERNLLAGRLSTPHRRQLVTLLSELIYERGRLLQRCERLRSTMRIMSVCPDVAVWYGTWRNAVEKFFLRRSFIDGELSELTELVVPDIRALLLLGIDTDIEIFNARLRMILS